MLPFTFLIFPGTDKAPLVFPHSLVRSAAVRGERSATAIWLMANIRKAAQAGWGVRGRTDTGVIALRPRDVVRADGGAAPHRRLEPAAERAAVHAVPAVCRCPAGSVLSPGTQSTLQQTTAYHMLSGESLLGIPIEAFADTVIGFLVFGTALMMTGRRKILHQHRIRDVRHVPRRRCQGLRVRLRPARHTSAAASCPTCSPRAP